MLPLVIEHDHDSETAVAAMEQLDPEGIWGVMGRAFLIEGTVAMRPFAFYGAEEIVNLGLDNQKPAEPESQTASEPEPPAPREESEEEPEEATLDSASLHRIRRLESLLEEIAESGRLALDDRKRARLVGLSDSLDGAALPLLAKAARQLAEASAPEVAAGILRGRYLTGVHRQVA